MLSQADGGPGSPPASDVRAAEQEAQLHDVGDVGEWLGVDSGLQRLESDQQDLQGLADGLTEVWSGMLRCCSCLLHDNKNNNCRLS